MSIKPLTDDIKLALLREMIFQGGKLQCSYSQRPIFIKLQDEVLVKDADFHTGRGQYYEITTQGRQWVEART